MRAVHTAEATAHGGREGRVRSSDGILDILLGVELRGHLEGLSETEAFALMRAAHEVCPCSNETRGNIEVRLLAVGPPVAIP
jgi:organic hydroperoxide reductase OsmC/OhrA